MHLNLYQKQYNIKTYHSKKPLLFSKIILQKDTERERIYDRVTKKAQSVKIDPPPLYQGIEELPEGWIMAVFHISFASPKDYFRSRYYQVCDLLLGELDKRFEQSELYLVL